MGAVDEVIDRLFAWLDRPWKAAALALLCTIGGIGFILYQERDAIAAVLMQRLLPPRLEASRFPAEAGRMLDATRGDAAILMSLSLTSNVIENVVAMRRDGVPWNLGPYPRRAINADSDARAIVDLLDNKPHCFDVTPDVADRESVGLLAQRREEAAIGIKRACLIVVPPIPGGLIGALFVGWRTPQGAAEEQAATIPLREAALKLAKW